AGPTDFLFVSLSEAMGIEVVLDDWQTSLARCVDGLDDILNLRVRSGLSPNNVVEPRNHQVTQCQTTGLESFDSRTDVTLFPGNFRAPGDNVVDADLLQLAHAGFVEVRSHAEADLRRIFTFGGHSEVLGRRCRRSFR